MMIDEYYYYYVIIVLAAVGIGIIAGVVAFIVDKGVVVDEGVVIDDGLLLTIGNDIDGGGWPYRLTASR